MSTNYYNEQTRRNGCVNEIRLNGRPAYIANYQDENGVCCSKIRETMEAANRDMEEHGYRRQMTAEQIRASIKVNEETFKQASATLRKILDEPEPRRPYHLERMIASLNLCTDIAKHRAKLEYQLQQAVQSGQ